MFMLNKVFGRKRVEEELERQRKVESSSRRRKYIKVLVDYIKGVLVYFLGEDDVVCGFVYFVFFCDLIERSE